MAEKRTAEGLTVEDMFQKFVIGPDEKTTDNDQKSIPSTNKELPREPKSENE